MTRRWVWLLGAAVLTPWLAGAQSAPSVDVGPSVSLDPEIRCWAHGEHSSVFAAIEPVAPITRIYFRCSLYPDYYFVDLDLVGDRYTAVLPQAESDCPSVYYYLEAVSGEYTSSRTRERVAEVSEANECRRRDPLVALFTGDPEIIIGAASALAPQMAPGFSAAGVAGFISAAGTTSAGGGLGTAAIAGIGGAAAAGGVLVAASGSDEASPDVVGPPAPVVNTPPVAGPVPPPPPPPQSGEDTTPLACASTEPSPAVIGVGEPIRLDASCSLADRVGDSGDHIADYIWDFSDGRRKTGRVINAVFRRAGSYEIVLTVVDGGTGVRVQQDSDTINVTVEDRVDACFTTSDVTPGNGCKVKFDGSCSQGNIEEYQWSLSSLYGSGSATGRSIVHDFVSCPMPATVTLKVISESGESASVTRQIMVNYQRTASEPPRTSILATVEATEARASARLVSNDGETLSLNQAGSQRVQVSTRGGTNRLAIYPVGAGAASGLVTLDFTSARGLVPGSLRVLEGDVVSIGVQTVVLRLAAPARLEYALR